MALEKCEVFFGYMGFLRALSEAELIIIEIR